MTPWVIDAQNIWKRFGKKTVLKGLNLQVPRGAVVGLLGSNGAGKSTLLKYLLGLLKVDEGQIAVSGDHYWIYRLRSKAKLAMCLKKFSFLVG